MKEKHIICVYTSNTGKFNHVQELCNDNKVLSFTMLKRQSIPEKNSSTLNARAKAIFGSSLTELPVLSSDEELEFPYLDKSFQPGARIRRIVGPSATDAELVKYYSNLLETLNVDQRVVIIREHYAIALNGEILGTSLVKESCELRLPPEKEWIDGRPLSSFHYVGPYSCMFSALTLKQRQKYFGTLGRPLKEMLESFMG